MQSTYSYPAILAASERVNWKVEDLIGGDKRLDFSKPFLPESLARVEPLDFLTPEERLTLNHIRSYGYLYTFVVAEGFILDYVLNHARPEGPDDDYRVRALLTFADEEAKHTHLFKVFCREFERDFGHTLKVIGPPEDVKRAVMAHDPLGVGLAILQIEWTTQRHYLESIQQDTRIDPVFKEMLRAHWIEEAQHTKSDTLLVQALADAYGPAATERAIEDYGKIGAFLDEGFMQQVQFDLENFMQVTGRELTVAERERFLEVQRQAVRWTFLGSGMTHEKFLGTLEQIRPAARQHVESVAPDFC